MMGPSSCFLFFTGPLPAAQAETQCEMTGAHLAKIETADADAVAELVVGTKDTYIGATDQAVEGTFLWGDGSSLTFTNWRAGEPNNGGASGIAENCAVIAGAKAGKGWDDRPCALQASGAGTYAYLCSF
jgi:hypothetical protein